MKLNVHSYESLGTFDGPGLRLVVFLQGCNFRCLYCANPDTIDLKGESKATDLQHIVDMAVSEKPFFGKRGGVTFSGGEPTIQAQALIPLVKKLKEQGILRDGEVLKDNGIPASLIGKFTSNNDKLIHNEDEIRYLERV